MTAAEKQRRYRENKAKQFGNKLRVTKSIAETASLKARIRELEEESRVARR
jgi:hypothetical protein